MTEENKNNLGDEEKIQEINSLKETIAAAERTIQEAKKTLMQLEGRPQNDSGDGNIVLGEFDGQIMIGDDGKQYPIPANYASKSKLVEGDRLKLTITPDGSFIYKQIGPANRKSIIGSVNQDEAGNFYVLAEGRPYKILLASITYFKVEPGDEVVIVTSKDTDSAWAAIENVLQKGGGNTANAQFDQNETNQTEEENPQNSEITNSKKSSVTDNWLSDIEDIKREIKEEKITNEQ